MEKNSNEIALLRRYFAALSERAVPTDSCIEAQRIFDAARGQSPAAECREIGDHTVECPVCAEAWRLALAIDYADEPANFIPRPQTSKASAWMMAVAAMLLLAVLSGNVYFSAFQPHPNFRDLQSASVTIDLAQDVAASRDGFTLRWNVSPESSSHDLTYRVQLRTSSDLREVVDERDWTEQSYLVQAEQVKDLPPSSVLLWQVEAISAEGQVVRSATRALTLR